MGNALAILDTPAPLSEKAAAFFTEHTNIPPKQTVPTITFKGKVWTISVNGEAKQLMRKDADGEQVPVNVFKAIVLDWNKRRGRAYYEGAYDPDKAAMPVCWSDDSVTPDDSVKEKQSPKCASCPMSARGSKVTDNGKSVAACAEHRMLVVVPASVPTFEPLRLKIPITSDWDGQSPDHEAAGWYGFKNYTDTLRAKQVDHTARVVTKIKFDPNVAYPKLLFGVDKWTDTDVVDELIPVISSENVRNLLSGTWTPNGVDGELTSNAKEPEDETETPPPPVTAKQPPKPAAPPKTVPKAAPPKAKASVVDDDDEDSEIILPGVDAPEAEAAKPVGATAKAGNGKAQAAPKAAAATKAAAPVVTDAALGDLLSDWDSE